MKKGSFSIETLLPAVDSKLLDSYSVGALMYTPATNYFIFDKLMGQAFGDHYSLSFCLEDSIDDSAVLLGEQTIVETFQKIDDHYHQIPYLPKLFIRVRQPDQIKKIYRLLGSTAAHLKGFILPKFSTTNAAPYFDAIYEINSIAANPIYMMPILESHDLIFPGERTLLLTRLQKLLTEHKEYILNLRVGGNDLCHAFGVRRNVSQTIYDIRPVANILSDIISVFYRDFVISGPVWEYFSDPADEWKTGLEQEIKMDLLNGFIGKTIIHPNQIAVVNQSLKPRRQDYYDALEILTFQNTIRQVSKSSGGTRMNEVKTHTNWARKQLILSYLYGVN